MLRIVTWNCRMAFHAKYERLLGLRPDIAIVPECAALDRFERKAVDFESNSAVWRGDDPNKGLAVFTFGDWSARLGESCDPRFKFFMALEVSGPARLNLLAVWAFNHRARNRATPNPPTTGEVIRHYAPFLSAAPSIVAGDFNASVVWDGASKYARFAALNSQLRECGLTSAYHSLAGCELGAECDNTLYWRSDASKGYHIDYVYLPTPWLPFVKQALSWQGRRLASPQRPHAGRCTRRPAMS